MILSLLAFFQYHLSFSIYFPSPIFLNLTFNRFLFSPFYSLFLHYFCLFSLFQLFNLFQDNFFHLSLFLFQYYTTLPPSTLLSALLFVFSFFFLFLFSFLIVRLRTSLRFYLLSHTHSLTHSLSLSLTRPSTLSIYSSFTLLSDRADKTDRSRMRRKKQNGSVARRAYDLFRREPPTRNI